MSNEKRKTKNICINKLVPLRTHTCTHTHKHSADFKEMIACHEKRFTHRHAYCILSVNGLLKICKSPRLILGEQTGNVLLLCAIIFHENSLLLFSSYTNQISRKLHPRPNCERICFSHRNATTM